MGKENRIIKVDGITMRNIFLATIRRLGDSGYQQNWLGELFKSMHRNYINQPISVFEKIDTLEKVVITIKEFWIKEYDKGKKISEYCSGYFTAPLAEIWLEESEKHGVVPRLK